MSDSTPYREPYVERGWFRHRHQWTPWTQVERQFSFTGPLGTTTDIRFLNQRRCIAPFCNFVQERRSDAG